MKAIHQEALDCYMFHKISKHISMLVYRNFPLMFCGVFCWIFENSCLGGEDLAQFFCPRSRAFALSLCPGWGNSPVSTPGGLPGGASGLAWN